MMSFAAAICSMVCDGIATGRWQTYPRQRN
jgi:hypothetical protein